MRLRRLRIKKCYIAFLPLDYDKFDDSPKLSCSHTCQRSSIVLLNPDGAWFLIKN